MKNSHSSLIEFGLSKEMVSDEIGLSKEELLYRHFSQILFTKSLTKFWRHLMHSSPNEAYKSSFALNACL